MYGKKVVENWPAKRKKKSEENLVNHTSATLPSLAFNIVKSAILTIIPERQMGNYIYVYLLTSILPKFYGQNVKTIKTYPKTNLCSLSLIALLMEFHVRNFNVRNSNHSIGMNV